jgi:farnesol dehydrogenase
MKYFITGATGFIGNRLTEELLKDGCEIHILGRSKKKVELLYGNRVDYFEGDLADFEVITKAMKGCDAVFHLAALAQLWSKNKTESYNANVIGTKNILEAALQNKIRKIVFTSSAATLAPSAGIEIVDETFPLPGEYLTDYEKTKAEAELLCTDYCKRGLEVVIVNPSRVYGPGELNKSNSVTILINKYISGKWRIIPGNGNAIGNYVFIDDVVNGHIQAMKNGIPGEKYILGGVNVSFNQFFKILRSVSGKNFRLFHLPFSMMMAVSEIELFMAETFGKSPLITPPWVKRYMQNRPISSNKAIAQLNYNITSLEEGMHKTIEWLLKK